MTFTKRLILTSLVWLSFGGPLALADSSIQGTYQAVLDHDAKAYYQFAIVTLRTVNSGNGNLKISANVRIYFGDLNSNEFLSYEYPDCPMNILTRQISLKNDNFDVSFIGYLKEGELSGDWYSPAVGRVGKFTASKIAMPPVPSGFELVKSVTGHYIGKLTNTNPNSSLPETVTISLVTTQDSTIAGGIKVSGNMRFYLGELGSTEYIETPFQTVDFNFYNRYITAKTERYGIAIKGNLELNGVLSGNVFADGLGMVGTIEARGQ